MPGSAAEAAGIEASDVLMSIDGEPLIDLRGYSSVLKSHTPGDQVELLVRRGDDELTLTATLAER